MTDAPADLITLERRGVVHVAGADARTFLDGLLTVDVGDANTPPRPAALLTPQGKVLHELHVHAAPDSAVRLDTARSGVEDLIKRLTLFRLRAKIDIADVSDTCVVRVAACAPHREIVEQSGNPDRDDPAAYDAWRVADGRPEQALDFDAGEVFPSDINLDLLGGVDTAKGCFVGQEVVSRMTRRGSIRKRTLVLDADGGPPARGAPITADDVTLGEALSSAGGKALALVRIDRLADADPASIRVEDRPARLTFPDWFPETARHVAARAS